MQPYVLRHSAKRFAWVYAIFASFAAIGLWLASLGGESALVGWMTFILCGGGGLALFAFLRSRVILTADSTGVHVGPATIPWADIDEFGTYVKWRSVSRQTFLGIRLKNYQGYISSIPPDQAARWAKIGNGARWVGVGGVAVDIATSGSGLEAAVDGLTNAPDVAALGGTPITGLEKLLVLNRKLTGGWDMGFSNVMNDSVRVAAAHLEAMRQSSI